MVFLLIPSVAHKNEPNNTHWTFFGNSVVSYVLPGRSMAGMPTNYTWRVANTPFLLRVNRIQNYKPHSNS